MTATDAPVVPADANAECPGARSAPRSRAPGRLPPEPGGRFLARALFAIAPRDPPPPGTRSPLTRSRLPLPSPRALAGTNADAAGTAAACAGCPNQAACASAPKGVDPDVVAVAERLRDVRRKILVLSGKGGVGKSTFASQLAYALSAEAEGETPGEPPEVGLLDIDICGPSAPVMTAQQGRDVHKSNSGWQPVYARDNLAVMSIGFLLPSADDAVIWRGPRKNGLIKQFLKDTEWGALDYLVVDAPPGTSDEHLSVVQYLKRAGVDGALIVTTPQEVAMADVRKELSFCKKVGIPVLGVVENMAGLSERCFGDEEEEEESGGLGGAPRFVDERTGADVTAAVRDAVSEKLGREFAERLRVEVDVFAPSRGGAAKMCADAGVPFLGRVPPGPARRRRGGARREHPRRIWGGRERGWGRGAPPRGGPSARSSRG